MHEPSFCFMTFPRASSLFLAVGGTCWAVFLLVCGFGFLHTSIAAGLWWALLWAPGFFAWYGYLRRTAGHFLFGRALFTWLVSIAANAWSFSIVYPWARLACVWISLALVVSFICLMLEGRRREICQPIVRVNRAAIQKPSDEHRE
jgi:hypothetical protein